MKPEPRLRPGATATVPAQYAGTSGPVALRHVLPGTPEAVRKTLALVCTTLASGQLGAGNPLTDTTRTTVELVLAEVLNNIVEHAYGAPERPCNASLPACPARLITLDLQIDGPDLRCVVRDEGAAMPAGRLPAGLRPSVTTLRDDLPEGGYGWFLIRSLTQDLRYVREPGCNRLSFAIPLTPVDACSAVPDLHNISKQSC